MRSGIRKKWDNLNFRVESIYRKYEYRKKAKIRLKRMNGGYKCTKEYNEIVVPFWKKYGLNQIISYGYRDELMQFSSISRMIYGMGL